MRLMIIFGLMLAATLAASQEPKSSEQFASDEMPNLSLGFSIRAMDTTANPCQDFYQYACGTWMKENDIPADKSTWGRFGQLDQQNLEILHGILEKVSANDPKRTPIEQEIGDYYAACIDRKAIDKKGLAPIQAELDSIAQLKDKSQLAAEIARLHNLGAISGLHNFREGNLFALFLFDSDADFKNASKIIAVVDQGGLGLPDRDYYFNDDPTAQKQREQYKQHVQNMFQLLGDKPEVAAKEAQTVFEIESALAAASMKRVDRREPANVYHKMTTAELAKLSPSFHWNEYFKTVGAPEFKELNVAVPEFIQKMQALIEEQPLENWKTYLRWRLVFNNAVLLPSQFSDEDFNFYNRTLGGQKEQEPRWQRCTRLTDGALGEALGQEYVGETFGKEGKERTLKMIQALEDALKDDITSVSWMTDATRQAALVKLAAITNKIGYPEHWRDYSSVKIVREDALGNQQRADSFEFRRELQKIGKDLDKTEWGMTPPTVNAYYSDKENNINFPAGILQPPFYDNAMDDGINFGGIGAVIGHELTHGFDDEGHKFDGQGNLRNWWAPEDEKAFNQRTQCLVDEYSNFVSVKDDKDPKNDVHLNGKLTLGENTADNGGLRLAYMALMHELAGKEPQKIDGFTPQQRFFLGYGQIWCNKMRPEAARQLALTNPHSPGKFRVIGVVSNMPEFQQAFGCKKGDAMVRENACHVW
ncbi:MAG TPA: M13 family metallopeptidase [Terriglobales bacterium]|jgi:putative endopeptidase|nr:M13 family metallopeptidase [Terriglobales bacterium]